MEEAIVSRKTQQKNFRVMLRVRAEFHFYKVITAESPAQAKQLALGAYIGDGDELPEDAIDRWPLPFDGADLKETGWLPAGDAEGLDSAVTYTDEAEVIADCDRAMLAWSHRQKDFTGLKPGFHEVIMLGEKAARDRRRRGN